MRRAWYVWGSTMCGIGLLVHGAAVADEDLLAHVGSYCTRVDSSGLSYTCYQPHVLSSLHTEKLLARLDDHDVRSGLYKELFLEMALLHVNGVRTPAVVAQALSQNHALATRVMGTAAVAWLRAGAANLGKGVRLQQSASPEPQQVNAYLQRAAALRETSNIEALNLVMKEARDMDARDVLTLHTMALMALDRDMMREELQGLKAALASEPPPDEALCAGLDAALAELAGDAERTRGILTAARACANSYAILTLEDGIRVLSQRLAATAQPWSMPLGIALTEQSTISVAARHQELAILSASAVTALAPASGETPRYSAALQRLYVEHMKRSMDGLLVTLAGALWDDIARARTQYEHLAVQARIRHENMLGNMPAQVLRDELPIADPLMSPAGLRKLSIVCGRLYNPLSSENGAGSKLVVVMHGWNPDALDNPYATEPWTTLVEAWNQVRSTYPGWDLLLYDWHQDAATGPKDLFAAEHGSAAAEAAYLHGWYLGQMLQRSYPHVTRVQLIAHSAGAWAARSAALLLGRSGVEVQVTLLDPYIPITKPVSLSLSSARMADVTPAASAADGQPGVTYVENYFTEDIALGTQTQFAWASSRATQARITYNDVEQIIRDIPPLMAGMINNAMTVARVIEGHGLPIAWYAATMFEPGCYAVGWAVSMPARERGAPPRTTTRHIVAVVDESGSMDGRKIEKARQGVAMLRDMLMTHSADATLGIVGFADTARVVCRPVTGADSVELDSAIGTLRAGGSTAIGLGIEQGLRLLGAASPGQQALVLLSDGEHNTGELWPYVESAARNGVAIHTINLEAGPEAARTLQRIAEMTGGEYFDADIGNIQQIYAAIDAHMAQQCTLLYRTDVIQQDETIDFEFTVPRPNGQTLSPPPEFAINLSWKGSRLEFQLLDAQGRNLSNTVRTVRRTMNSIVARVSGLKPDRYTIRVIGADIPDAVEPFCLQVLSDTEQGLFVKPPRSSYRVAEDVRLSGTVRGLGQITDLVFTVHSPVGTSQIVRARVRGSGSGASNAQYWEVVLPPPAEIGVHRVIGSLGGVPYYEGSFMCGTMEEVATRRRSVLTVIDQARLALRRTYEQSSDPFILQRYAALTYAASLAQAVQALEPLWSDLARDWQLYPTRPADALSAVVPFAGNGGIEAVGLADGARMVRSTRSASGAATRSISLTDVLRDGVTSYWLRVPCASQAPSQGMAIVVEGAPMAGEQLRPILAAFRAPGDWTPWEALDVRVKMEANEIALQMIAAIERLVQRGALSRATACACYDRLIAINSQYFTTLLLTEPGGAVIYGNARHAETPRTGDLTLARLRSVDIIADGKVIGRIRAQLVSSAQRK